MNETVAKVIGNPVGAVDPQIPDKTNSVLDVLKQAIVLLQRVEVESMDDELMEDVKAFVRNWHHFIYE